MTNPLPDPHDAATKELSGVGTRVRSAPFAESEEERLMAVEQLRRYNQGLEEGNMALLKQAREAKLLLALVLRTVGPVLIPERVISGLPLRAVRVCSASNPLGTLKVWLEEAQ